MRRAFTTVAAAALVAAAMSGCGQMGPQNRTEVLRGELSGPEIASELHVSLNTLRTHTKNIYEKLAVNGRRAAVRRAEELNLLRRDKSA